jgi:hypothetical protein
MKNEKPDMKYLERGVKINVNTTPHAKLYYQESKEILLRPVIKQLCPGMQLSQKDQRYILGPHRIGDYT